MTINLPTKDLYDRFTEIINHYEYYGATGTGTEYELAARNRLVAMRETLRLLTGTSDLTIETVAKGGLDLYKWPTEEPSERFTK